jgi:dihydrofolate synthase/folylpolyglutamate synthase
MGGRLDSTNVCQPLVTVITSISLDHTRQLGGTLAEIASEKAGIIKRGVPVISGVCEESAREVIVRRAKKCRAPLIERGRAFDVCYHAATVSGKSAASFDYVAHFPAHVTREQLTLGILGQHQATNAASALAVIDVLRGAGWHFADEQVRRGLAEVRCRGRVELLKEKPLMVVDAAHNVASVHAFLNALDEVGFSGPRSLVFATAKEKDIDGMLQLLLPRFEHVVFTRYLSNPRAEDPLQLAAKAAELSAADPQGNGQCWEVQEDPLAAWNAAQDRFGVQGAVCVTGSFYIAAEMRRLILQQHPPLAYAARAELAFP